MSTKQGNKYWTERENAYLTEVESEYQSQKSLYKTFTSGPRKGLPRTEKDRVLRFIIEGLKLELMDSCIAKPKFKGLKEGSFWFIGKNGSVRAGKNISTSFSLTDRVKVMMEKWEAANDK
jgi:hypothetical protein